jgi:hypothetical protein
MTDRARRACGREQTGWITNKQDYGGSTVFRVIVYDIDIVYRALYHRQD